MAISIFFLSNFNHQFRFQQRSLFFRTSSLGVAKKQGISFAIIDSRGVYNKY